MSAEGVSALQALCRELAEKDEDQSRPADNLTTIIDIGLELTKPFFELRPLYADPSIEDSFWLLTGETAGQISHPLALGAYPLHPGFSMLILRALVLVIALLCVGCCGQGLPRQSWTPDCMAPGVLAHPSQLWQMVLSAVTSPQAAPQAC